MIQIEFCQCSQKGSYAFGIITLTSGELACKNCRGVIPPSEVSEEVLEMQPPELKQRIKRDYSVDPASKPLKLDAAALGDLVDAQNRTTHAVRSLAITFVAAPIISIAIIVAVVVASASGNTSLMIFTGVFGVIIGLGTLVVSLEELRKSKVY